MAQNVTIANVDYSNVPSVRIPKTIGIDDAIFYDTSDADMTASDLAEGKVGYTSTGKVIGTSSGGGGGGGDEEADVIFYDPFGNIVYTYSAEDFLGLASLPAMPSITGFTSQEWNWTLADAQEYVEDYGKIDIGLSVIPTDGMTHILIDVDEAPLAYAIHCQTSSSSYTGTIDWGDGTTDTFSNTRASGAYIHTYTAVGNYEIIVSSTTRLSTFEIGRYSSTTYNWKAPVANPQATKAIYYGANCCTSITNEIGGNIEYITLPNGLGMTSRQAISYLPALKFLVLPKGFTTLPNSFAQYCANIKGVILPKSITTIPTNFAYYTSNIKRMIIPNSVTSIGNSAFLMSKELTTVTIPNSVTSIGSSVFQNTHITTIAIPNTVTTIGGSAFNNAHYLEEIKIPSSVTTFGASVFYLCYGLKRVTFEGSMSTLPSSTFYNCRSLQEVVFPTGLTTIESQCFGYCVTMSELTIPEGVTTLSSSSIFTNMVSLSKLTLPSTLTTINGSQFDSNTVLTEIHMLGTTPPTLSTSSIMSGANSYIYVPAEAVEAYQTATNWTGVASRIVGE